MLVPVIIIDHGQRALVAQVIFTLGDPRNVTRGLFSSENPNVLRGHPTVEIEIKGGVGKDKRERVLDLVGRFQNVEHDGGANVSSAV